MVRYAGRVTAYFNVCGPHHANGMHDAMEVSRLNGGAISTARIDVPVRKPKEDCVNVNSLIPRTEHSAMTVVAQTLRMSQRAFVRMAINNQVRLSQLDLKRKESDHEG